MAAQTRRPNRTVAVFVTLVAMLASTSVLLLLLAPPPLTTNMWRSLFAVDSPDSLDAIFQTQAPVSDGHWKYIFIHQSRTPGGDAISLGQPAGDADHFVIGNGDGSVDGEVQMTQAWNRQGPITAPPPAVSRWDARCISICVVGDFNRTRPTPTQQLRLTQLVGTLRSRLRIPASGVTAFDRSDTAGVGRAFPLETFRAQIVP